MRPYERRFAIDWVTQWYGEITVRSPCCQADRTQADRNFLTVNGHSEPSRTVCPEREGGYSYTLHNREGQRTPYGLPDQESGLSPHGLPDWEDSNLPIVCLTGRMCTPYSLNNRECQRASYRLPGQGNPLSPHGLDDREWAEERRRCANIATGGAASVPPPSTKSYRWHTHSTAPES